MAEEADPIRTVGGGSSFNDEAGVQTHFKIKSEGLNEVAQAVKKIADEWSRLNTAVRGTDVGRIKEVMSSLGKATEGGGSTVNPGKIEVPSTVGGGMPGPGGQYTGQRAAIRSAEAVSENGGPRNFTGERAARREAGEGGGGDGGNGGLGRAGQFALGTAGAAVAAVPAWWGANRQMNEQLGRYSGMFAQANGGNVNFGADAQRGMPYAPNRLQNAVDAFGDRYLGAGPGFGIDRGDALATAGMMEGRFGPVYSGRGRQALAGQATISQAAGLSGAEGAGIFNQLMTPEVTNRMIGWGIDPLRQRGGGIQDVGQFTQGLFQRMNASGTALQTNAPGEMLYQNFRQLGIDPETTGQTLIAVQQANEELQRLQRSGRLSRDVGSTISAENIDEYRRAGGLETAYTSRVGLERQREEIATSIFGESQASLVQTNDWLAAVAEHTQGILKAVMPLGAHLGTIASEIPILGRVISDPVNSLLALIVAKDHLFGGGGGGGWFGGGAGAKGGFLRTAGRGLGAAGLGLTAANVVSGVAPDPDSKEATDWGNVAGYAAGGAVIGSVVPGVGTLAGGAIGGAVGLAGGLAREFMGDYVEGRGDQQPKGGVSSSSGGWTHGQALAYIAEENPKRGGIARGHQISGLKAAAAIAAARMMKANPRLTITSGFRTYAEQVDLKRRKPNLAAKPGTSLHETGNALDLAPASEYGWLFQNAPRFGLTNPFGSSPGTKEDWHWQASGGGGKPGGAPDNDAAAQAGVETGVADTGGGLVMGKMMDPGLNFSIAAAIENALNTQNPFSAFTSFGGGGGAGGSTGAVPGGDGEVTSSGGIIGFDQAYNLLKNAGFDHNQAIIMAAIAKEESGLNPRAHNPNAKTGDNSYGLWQINMLGSMGPARRASFGIQSNEELFDPATNARAAKNIFDGQGFKAWSVYKKGIHEQWIDDVQAAISKSAAPTTPSSQQSPPDAGDFTTADAGGSMGPRFTGGGGSATIRTGGPSIYAPIKVVMMNGSDAEALRAAETIQEHIERLTERDEARAT